MHGQIRPVGESYLMPVIITHARADSTVYMTMGMELLLRTAMITRPIGKIGGKWELCF
jgi:hypothetical protein